MKKTKVKKHFLKVTRPQTDPEVPARVFEKELPDPSPNKEYKISFQCIRFMNEGPAKSLSDMADPEYTAHLAVVKGKWRVVSMGLLGKGRIVTRWVEE